MVGLGRGRGRAVGAVDDDFVIGMTGCSGDDEWGIEVLVVFVVGSVGSVGGEVVDEMMACWR